MSSACASFNIILCSCFLHMERKREREGERERGRVVDDVHVSVVIYFKAHFHCNRRCSVAKSQCTK